MDLVKSQSYSLKDRNTIQKYIMMVIKNLNEVFADALAKDVKPSAGDEYQGLFLSTGAAYLYFRMFNMLVFPVELRVGIGIGEWNVKIENADTTTLDGPAYHSDRYAVDNVKNAPGYYVFFHSRNKSGLFINSFVNASFTLTSSLSAHQNQLMLLYELLYPINYHRSLSCDKIDLITELIKQKNRIGYYINSESEKRYPFENLESVISKPIFICAVSQEGTFYVTGGKNRGIATALSKILKVSRQSVEKALKAGNIYEIRNLTIVSLKFIDEHS